MVPKKNAEEIIKSIYCRIYPDILDRPGKIHNIELNDYNYRVAVENNDKATLRATVASKDVQDVYDKNYLEKSAKYNIEESLQRWVKIS